MTGPGDPERNLGSRAPAGSPLGSSAPDDDWTVALPAGAGERTRPRSSAGEDHTVDLSSLDDRTVHLPGAAPGTAPGAVPGSASGSTPADQPPQVLAPGVMIGSRYRLSSLIGTDVHGNRFWRARDSVLPRDMAITVLPDSSGTSATVARTLRAGRLRHIGLPQTLDLGTESGQTYVVGQWVDGATLTDLLAKGPLEPAVASAIGGRIAEAVSEAHRNGLALGSIDPSLVRVNVDGQARFSHVIAHATATPAEDIKSVGALLYLMLTGLWPASDALAMARSEGAGLRTAPQRGGREVPAAEVNPDVPAALSQLTARALHPEDPDGIHAVGALASLLQTPDPTIARPAAQAAAEAPPPTMSPADRRLRKERRIKVTIASGFIAAFVALILIVVGTLARNTLQSIDQQNKNLLDPLQDRPSNSAPATTVGPKPSGTSSAPSTGGSPTSGPSSSSAPAVRTAKVVGAEVYDPEGHGEKDYTDFVDRLYDGDPASTWQTWSYKQQFKANAEGGFKVGVGVVLQFDQPITPQSVLINSTQTGLGIQIRSATSLEPGAFAGTQLLASGSVAGGPVVIPVQNAPKSQFLLVFLNQIPQSGSGYQGQIGEITVSGS